MALKRQEDIATKIRSQIQIEPPKNHLVIYLNDDVTTIEFVIDSLISIFNHNWDDASELTTKIHTEGSAVVAVLPFEIAEHKAAQVTLKARHQNYPLLVKIEPDS